MLIALGLKRWHYLLDVSRNINSLIADKNTSLDVNNRISSEKTRLWGGIHCIPILDS